MTIAVLKHQRQWLYNDILLGIKQFLVGCRVLCGIGEYTPADAGRAVWRLDKLVLLWDGAVPFGKFSYILQVWGRKNKRYFSYVIIWDGTG